MKINSFLFKEKVELENITIEFDNLEACSLASFIRRLLARVEELERLVAQKEG